MSALPQRRNSRTASLTLRANRRPTALQQRLRRLPHDHQTLNIVSCPVTAGTSFWRDRVQLGAAKRGDSRGKDDGNPIEEMLRHRNELGGPAYTSLPFQYSNDEKPDGDHLRH
jgi:hypothetical protein